MQEDSKDKQVERGILDAVSFSQQSSTMQSLNPQSLVLQYLEKLKEREKDVLIKRYGLDDGHPLTLEKIGQKLNLTRERIRQIERESLKKIGGLVPPTDFTAAVDLIHQIVNEHGGIISEKTLLETILLNKDTEVNRAAILFILQAMPGFHEFPETSNYHKGWFVNGFNKQSLELVISISKKIFTESEKALGSNKFYEKIRESMETAEAEKLSDEILESFTGLSRDLGKNPFGEWGLANWSQIKPHDVGDKAYLVLHHHQKPEHYSKITEIINKSGFDSRIAQKETVHNELIKDKRFVLIGRGIYALSEWGYREGDVGDVIEAVLRDSGAPLTREEIIEKVLKQRMVKKNTIIFGLLNKTRFQKTSDNKYILV